MDQGTHGRRSFHRIWQPHVQRQLTRFADGTTEDEQRDRGRHRHPDKGCLSDHFRDRRLFQTAGSRFVEEEQGARLGVEPQHPDQESQIADPSRDESLLRRRRRAGLLIPEANQQIGCNSHKFPTHEQEQQIVGNHQTQHRRREQREVAEEHLVVLILLHVGGAEPEDQRADEGDHHHHDGGERIHDPPEPNGFGPHLEPGEVEEVRLIH